MGLRETILQANTSDEVRALLVQGAAYKYASRRTKSAWKHAAERRVRQLDKPVETPKAEKVDAAPKPVKPNKKNRRNA